MTIFNRKLLKLRRENIAANFSEYNFIKKEVSKRLLERIDEIYQKFPLILDIGSHTGEIQEILQKKAINSQVIECDLAFNMLKHSKGIYKIVADEEALPFRDTSFDLIISVFSLQNVNNLAEVLQKIFELLKPGGLFLCSMPAFSSLGILSQSLVESELAVHGGFTPRIHPFIDGKTAGNLLAQQGFKEILADRDSINIMYKDFKNILRDLRGMGESNLLLSYKKSLNKIFLEKLQEKLQTFKLKEHYPINIEICNLLGWKK